jgi:hypothetical protein
MNKQLQTHAELAALWAGERLTSNQRIIHAFPNETVASSKTTTYKYRPHIIAVDNVSYIYQSVVYSYDTPIAYKFEADTGRQVYLITTDKYSVTTKRHTTMCAQAVQGPSHTRQSFTFPLDGIDPTNIEELRASVLRAIEKQLHKYKTATVNKQKYLLVAEQLNVDYLQFLEAMYGIGFLYKDGVYKQIYEYNKRVTALFVDCYANKGD